MTGSESKNLVPVDWVSAAMTRIILDESLHGRTYHFTSDTPTSVGTLCSVFEGLVVEMAAELKRQRETQAAAGTARPKPAAAFDPLTLGKLFLDQMHVYKAYWRDDPRFDGTNTQLAVPGLPAPVLDEETIRRLCRFAIANNFRWPPPGRVKRQSTARASLEGLLGSAAWSAPRSASAIGLAATGAGGGQWTIAIDSGLPVSLHVGLPAASVPTVWLAADTLERLLAGVVTAGELRGRGELVVEAGDPAGRRLAVDVIGRLTSRPASLANA
jgi:hypothetical protein